MTNSPQICRVSSCKDRRGMQSENPEANKIIERDKYVDDLIHSCLSVQDAFKRITDIEATLTAAAARLKNGIQSSSEHWLTRARV